MNWINHQNVIVCIRGFGSKFVFRCKCINFIYVSFILTIVENRIWYFYRYNPIIYIHIYTSYQNPWYKIGIKLIQSYLYLLMFQMLLYLRLIVDLYTFLRSISWWLSLYQPDKEYRIRSSRFSWSSKYFCSLIISWN